MIFSTIKLLVTLNVLFFFLYLLMTITKSKTRKVNNTESKLWLKVFRVVNGGGYVYADAKIKQLSIYFIFVCSILGYLFSPFGIVLGPILGVLGLYVFLRVKEKSISQNAKQINDELCYAIARRLRSGESLIDALLYVQTQFKKSKLISNLNSYINNGLSLQRSIEKITDDHIVVTNESEKMLCGTIALAHQMGGNSARIFERIGDSFHHTYELVGDTSSALAQVRVSTLVISLLPVGFLSISTIMGIGGTAFLFTTPIGFVCLATGMVLQATGILWMKKLVQKGVGIWTT